MDFVLFVLLNAVLLIRPAELVPALQGVPLFDGLLVICLVASAPGVFRQLWPAALASRPVTACVVGLLFAVVLSHLSHMSLWGVRNSGTDFLRVLLYYLLLVAVLNTAGRLHRFLLWLIVFIGVLAAVAVVQYHDLVSLPALTTLEDRDVDDQTGQEIVIRRLRSTGIYNDPNDLCLILVVGVMLCLCAVSNRDAGPRRFIWLAPLLLFLCAIAETKSRGGFLALVAGLVVLFQARFGWRKTALLVCLGLPPALLLFGGRQTSLSTARGTSQERIQMWSQALDLFREAPVFGIGQGEFADRAGLVAHNSFAHCFAEIGFFGGTLFLGAFFCAAATLWQLNARRERVAGAWMRTAIPCMTAAVLAYGVGLLSLSRAYVAPTYLVLALATAVARLARPTEPAVPLPKLRVNFALARRVTFASVFFLASLYVFVRTFVHWG